MERDFMGLNSKVPVVVKEEALEGCNNPDGFEAFNSHQTGEIQSVHFPQLHHDSKQAVQVTMNNPFFRPHFAGAPVNPHLLGGIPVASPHLVLPSTGPFFAHTTESWCSSKAASAQLTIFYGGMVNVYDDVSPEKAQAIMFLAGHGAFAAAMNAPQAQLPTPAGDAYGTVSSPLSVSSLPPGNKNEAAKRMGGLPMTSLGQAMQSAIPQARRASLARFLEKRKERVMASAPYSLSESSIGCAANSDAIVVASE